MRLLLLSVVSAHIGLHQLYVNGKAADKEAGIRTPPTNGPIKDLSS